MRPYAAHLAALAVILLSTLSFLAGVRAEAWHRAPLDAARADSLVRIAAERDSARAALAAREYVGCARRMVCPSDY